MFGPIYIHGPYICVWAQILCLGPNMFGTKYYVWAQTYLDICIMFGPKHIWIFGPIYVWAQILCLGPYMFGPKDYVWAHICLGPKIMFVCGCVGLTCTWKSCVAYLVSGCPSFIHFVMLFVRTSSCSPCHLRILAFRR